jgi:hypothetical protein
MGKCRNPRCSLEGRSGWAKKWATCLTVFLERQPESVAKYAGTLIGPPTDRSGIIERRSAFTKAIRSHFGGAARLLAVSEVGPVSGRWHDHYVMVSDGVEVSESEVSRLWGEACGGEPGAKVHEHGPIRNVSDCSKYIFKNNDNYYDPRNQECVRLLAKGTPNLTWGSRLISEKDRETLWRERVAAWYPASESVGVDLSSGTVVPPGNNPTANVRANIRKTMVFNRAPEVVDLSSGTVVPPIEPTVNIQINMGKSTVKSRVTGTFRAGLMRWSRRNHGIGSHSRRYRGDIRASIGQRPVSHRRPSELRSTDLMPERRLETRPGRQARPP